jgi:chromosome segregation protein
VYLKRLEIQGFKSFAKKTTLEFEKGIISVVGPNGSGKSNFADSIRWVLGEQSMKAIRSKKSEDVIFAGSDKKSKQGMAEVSITFDNSDRKIPLDFSEVNITRRLFRDGESEYLINKRPTRLMDIAEILGKSGYGGYSYHIISQGTIDQLILSGPTAVKTLIEEASGVKPYYTKRERALRKLERTEQNLLRVADLLAEIEPRLRSLRRQTKKAADRDGLQSELMQLRQKYFAWQYHQVGKTLGESASKLEYFDKQVNELNEEIKTLLEKLSHAEKKSATKSSEYSRLQQELRKIEKQKNTVQEDLAMVRGQLKAGYSGQPGDIQELKRREGELKSKVTEYQSKLKGLNEKLGSEKFGIA